jgi:Ca2+-transporting ATPase
MGATVFSLFNILAGISARDETHSAFNRDLLADRRQIGLYGLSIVLTILATELGFLQRILGTTPLTGQQWLLCIIVAASILVVDEVIKSFMRRRTGAQSPRQASTPVLAQTPA